MKLLQKKGEVDLEIAVVNEGLGEGIYADEKNSEGKSMKKLQWKEEKLKTIQRVLMQMEKRVICWNLQKKLS